MEGRERRRQRKLGYSYPLEGSKLLSYILDMGVVDKAHKTAEEVGLRQARMRHQLPDDVSHRKSGCVRNMRAKVD